jgi:hypothetical protein
MNIIDVITSLFSIIKSPIDKYGILGLIVLAVALFLGFFIITYIFERMGWFLKIFAILLLIIFIIGVNYYLFGKVIFPPTQNQNITLNNTTVKK